MKKSDALDRRRAAAYAWGQVPSSDGDDDEDAGGDLADGERADASDAVAGGDLPLWTGDENDIGRLDEEAFRICETIAIGVDRAWALPPGQQAELASTLLLRADAIGMGYCAMVDHPLQSVRLLRLAVRCGGALSDEAREAACNVVLWVDFAHPEVVDLLVETAEAEDMKLCDALGFVLHVRRDKDLFRSGDASVRLARLLDEGPTTTTRRIAASWLYLAAKRDAIPALRRALRLPCFVLRFRAFDLLEQRFPDAIEVGDLLFLVEEAVVHPPPELLFGEDLARAVLYFPERLQSALERARPAGAIEPLLRIVEGRCALGQCRFEGFDSSWALGVLAAVYPDVAVPLIDERMRHVEWDRRMLAAIGAGHLPDDLAWPRLLALAADAMPDIAERAQERWLARRGTLCPLDPLAGVDASLLAGPPDEAALSRLAVMRRAPLDARAAMASVLFAEAPDPAALAVLLFAAPDGSLWECQRRRELPASREALAASLVEKFGAPALRGVVALAERYPEGRRGWLHALCSLARGGSLPGGAIDVDAIERAAAEADAREAERAIAGMASDDDDLATYWEDRDEEGESDDESDDESDAAEDEADGPPRDDDDDDIDCPF